MDHNCLPEPTQASGDVDVRVMEMQSGPRQMELSIGRWSVRAMLLLIVFHLHHPNIVVVVVIIAPHGIRINPPTDSPPSPAMRYDIQICNYISHVALVTRTRTRTTMMVPCVARDDDH